MSRPWKVALGRCTPRRASSPAPRRTISASGARLTTGASSPLSGARNRWPPARTATMLREVPTPGSTTATCTVPAGKYPKACASQKPASAGQCTTISCVRSMMRAAGKRVSMQPFMTPTNGPWWPKSVVMVMTPEALGAFMGSARAARAPLSAAGTAAARRTAAFRAGATPIGIGHGLQPLRLDVLAAHRAGAVATGGEAPQRPFDLLQLFLGRVRDGPEHVVVLALRHLLGEVGGQRVRLVAQISARIAGALAQLVAALEQSVAYRLGIHFAPPGTSGCPPAAASFLEPLLQPVERLDELPHPFALELRRDGLQIDIEPLQALVRIAAFGNVALKPQLRSAQAPIGIQGLERHGVDRLGHHQLLDILDRAVARILGGGRGAGG